MENFSIYAVCAINLFIAVRSCTLIYRKRIHPSLAMWLFFDIAISVSLFTYFKVGDFSFKDNILNVADLFMATSVMMCILFFGSPSTRFNRFDLVCLGLVVLILIFWLITQAHLIANILVQLIMVISYFPTFKRLYVTRTNTESYTVWIAMLAASLMALMSANGLLAKVYVWRAIVCIVAMLGFMWWVDRKKLKACDA